MKIFYDVVTKQDIIFEDGKFVSKCREMGLDNTQFSHLTSPKKQLFCYKRYILPKNKDKIFTLVEVDTGIEYDCIATLTLEIHLGCKLTMNEVKYVYELLAKRQTFATIQGRVFYLKGADITNVSASRLKGNSIKIDDHKKQCKIKERITNSFRSRIKSAIKRFKKGKILNRNEPILGCESSFFIGYIEALFKPNMTWDNYGDKWHIDHIVPCSTFDLTQEDQQYKCFHYTNLRPLWATTEIARKHGDMESIGNLNRKKIFRKMSPPL